MCLATVIYSTERDNGKNTGMKNLSLSPYISVHPYGKRDKFFIPVFFSIIPLGARGIMTERAGAV